MDFNLIFSNMGISANLMQDIIFLAIVVLISFVFGMFIGRFRLVTVLINIYISLALLKAIPKGYLPDYSYNLLFFFALLIGLTLAGKKLFEIHISGAGSKFLWRVFAVSFLEIMLLVSVVLTLLPKKVALNYVSKNIYYYLTSPNAYFFWLVVPLVFIIMIHKKLKR